MVGPLWITVGIGWIISQKLSQNPKINPLKKENPLQPPHLMGFSSLLAKSGVNPWGWNLPVEEGQVKRTPNKKQIQDPPLKCKYAYIYIHILYIYTIYIKTKTYPMIDSLWNYHFTLTLQFSHSFQVLALLAPPPPSPPSPRSAAALAAAHRHTQHTRRMTAGSRAWGWSNWEASGRGFFKSICRSRCVFIILRKSWRVWINNLWIIYRE